jgi:hypothetical protein
MQLGRLAEGEAGWPGSFDELEPREAVEQRAQRDRPLQPGHVEAEAMVPAEAEREVVPSVLPTHVEPERILEHLRVAAGGERADTDELPAIELLRSQGSSVCSSSAR